MKNSVYILLVLNLVCRSQNTFTITAPPNGGSLSSMITPNCGPQSAYHRSCFYIHRYEMLPLANAQINTVSFLLTQGNGSLAVTGNFTLYLQNTTDKGFFKPQTFGLAIANMNPVYNGVLTIPATGPAIITVTLASSFNYSGDGLYVAYDWKNVGLVATADATFACTGFFNNLNTNTFLNPWHLSDSSSTSSPVILNNYSVFRPALLISGVNTRSNDLSVLNIGADGLVPNSIIQSPVSCRIVNNGTLSANNVTVAMNVTGSNPYTATQVLASLPPGIVQMVNFTGYTPVNNGISALGISVLNADDDLTNNVLSTTQSVTCNEVSFSPPSSAFPMSYGNPNACTIAYRYNFPTTQTLTAVKLGVGTLNVNSGQQLHAVLADQNGNLIATGNTLNISPGTTMTLPFTTPQLLTGQTAYFIGVAQMSPYSQPFRLSQPVQYIPAGFYLLPLTGGYYQPLYNFNRTINMSIILDIASPSISVTGNTTICLGTSATLTMSSAGTFSWSNGASTTSIVVSPTTSTSYSVTASNGICMDIKTVSVAVNLSPTVQITGNIGYCVGSAGGYLQGSGAQTYSWSTGNLTQFQAILPGNPGVQVYTLTGYNNPCPPASKTVQVSIFALPVVTVTSSKKSVCSTAAGGSTLQLQGLPTGGIFSGTSVSSSGVFTPLQIGSNNAYYTYTDNSTSCTNTAVISVLVQKCVNISENESLGNLEIYPNPSEDGVFLVSGLTEVVHISIYDCLGQKIGRTDGSNLIDLSKVGSGTYFLLIEGKTKPTMVKLLKL